MLIVVAMLTLMTGLVILICYKLDSEYQIEFLNAFVQVKVPS